MSGVEHTRPVSTRVESTRPVSTLGESTSPGPPATLFRVTGGGAPSAEELAALTVAILSLQSGPAPEPTVSGWQRAAIAEAVGGRPAYSAADTNRVRYLRPHPG